MRGIAGMDQLYVHGLHGVGVVAVRRRFAAVMVSACDKIGYDVEVCSVQVVPDRIFTRPY